MTGTQNFKTIGHQNAKLCQIYMTEVAPARARECGLAKRLKTFLLCKASFMNLKSDQIKYIKYHDQKIWTIFFIVDYFFIQSAECKKWLQLSKYNCTLNAPTIHSEYLVHGI